MKEILFAANTFKECNILINELEDDLFNKGAFFYIDKRRMHIRTKNANLVFVSETSDKSNLFGRKLFDYYMFTGLARWNKHGFHEFCVSKTKIKAKEIQNKEELIRIICEG